MAKAFVPSRRVRVMGVDSNLTRIEETETFIQVIDQEHRKWFQMELCFEAKKHHKKLAR